MLTLLTTPEALADQGLIAQQVFLIMAGIELIPVASCPPQEILISSILHYSEPFEGAVLIECSPQLAFAFTGELMSVAAPTTMDEDVTDAMGELANMIGGNLKGLMPPETCISSPVVLRPEQLADVTKANTRLSRICLAGEAGYCRISLLEACHR